MENRNKDFRNSLTEQFQDFCKRYNVDPSLENYTQYLIDRNVIIEKTISRFLVVDKWADIMEKCDNIQQAALWQIEDNYGIPSTTARGHIAKFNGHFCERPSIAKIRISKEQ